MFVTVWIFQEGTPIMVDIAGPLCFQGDYQVSCYNQTPWSELAPYNSIIVSKAKDVELPPPEDGDILAIHDTGAYTMSMYCKWVADRFSCKRFFYPSLYFLIFFLFR